MSCRFYFDFSAMYVGVGMICPYLVNISLLVGSILSWGIMWPLISKKEGIWFPAGLPETDMQGLQGYKIFISIAMILGDGLYNFVKVLSRTIMSIVKQAGQNKSLPESITSSTNIITVDFDEKRRNEAFEKDQIPKSYALVGYIAIAIISIGILPHMFPPLKWYHIVTGYIIAPVFAFCNAYGCGLTDWGMASTYGKLAIFTVGAWVGASHGGVLAGLASCGVMMNIVSTAADLMQDFKTGYLTLSSPKSMFISQIIGTAIGCVVSPCVFWLFYKAFPDIGTPHSAYPVPYSGIYRSMAIIGVNGLDSLPKHCVTICLVFFISAVVINLVRDLVGEKIAAFIPVPMAMAIPLYMGSYFTIDMCVGSLILFTWEKLNKTEADAFAPAVASGLICGDGIWSLPAAFLSLANIKPPICMKFLSRSDNLRVDSFLSGQS